MWFCCISPFLKQKNMSENIYNMNRNDLEKLIDKVVTCAFEKYMPLFLEKLPVAENLVTTEGICKALRISRQTLTNWRNSERVKSPAGTARISCQ